MKLIITIAAILAFVLGVGMVAAAWPMLPAFALVTLAVTLALATVAGGVGIYWLVGKANIQHAQARAVLIEASKVHADNSALLIKNQVIQLQTGAIGGYGTISQLRQYQVMPPLAPAQVAAPLMPTLDQPDLLPIAPTFSEIAAGGWRPSRKQLLLGYSHSGPIYGDLTALLSTAVAGRPGQGKSSLLRLISAQMTLTGGNVAILDPHGSISEDVPGAVFTASTGGELDDAGAWLVAELERRMLAYRKGQRQFNPVMCLNDEFPVISLASKEATAAIGRVVLEGRKVSMFATISGQGLPASQFGGSLVRDALSSRYVFQTTARQGQLAGLDKDAVKLLERLDVGRCILDGPVKPQIVAVPYVTTADLLAVLAGVTQQQEMPQSHATQQNSRQHYTTDGGSKPEAATGRYSASESVAAHAHADKVVTAEYRELLPATPGDLSAAYQAYQAGANSVRKMREAMQCSQSRASDLLQQLRERYY